MHIMDNVQGVNINAGKPFHHVMECIHYLIVFQYISFILTVFGTYLLSCLLVDTAVESVKQAFCQIGAGAEELHFLTDSHGGYTAGNAVVIAVGNAH